MLYIDNNLPAGEMCQ